MARVLIIDDNEQLCRLLFKMVQNEGYEAACAYTLAEGLKQAASTPFDVVFLDVMLPDGNGLDKIAAIHNGPSSPEVIILTGAGTADGAEMAIKSGAWNYIAKPASLNVMTLNLLRAFQYREEKLKKKPPADLKIEGIIGKSAAMKRCYELLAEAAFTDANVIITGETGTGKELFAKAIHRNSRRAGKNFVVVDCAALQDTLTESTLFGYEKGAFTGATERRDGLIRQGNGGTLFLDEVGELPLAIQKSFLRVLQEHRYRPLGAAKEIDSDFRLIAATNRDLDRMVETGLFRNELLFRLRALTICLPPLREHPEDITEIAIYHTAKICKRSNLDVKQLSPDFLDAILSYHWPGNVRELVNALERAIAAALSSPTLFSKHLASSIRVQLARAVVDKKSVEEAATDKPDQQSRPMITLKELRESIYEKAEKEYLRMLMDQTKGNIAAACKISDLSRARLYQLIKKHGISMAD
ncbi:MAG: sigma-54-dependent Fis family transcriptional regulator [Deltaproteobacteria bacterium]|nr:sigma-54-dependent Fis family transcriptional regulator [Deltaproteobacteria bacterium]